MYLCSHKTFCIRPNLHTTERGIPSFSEQRAGRITKRDAKICSAVLTLRNAMAPQITCNGSHSSENRVAHGICVGVHVASACGEYSSISGARLHDSASACAGWLWRLGGRSGRMLCAAGLQRQRWPCSQPRIASAESLRRHRERRREVLPAAAPGGVYPSSVCHVEGISASNSAANVMTSCSHAGMRVT